MGDARFDAPDWREIVDRLPIGLYRTTAEGCILSANPAFARLLGFDSPDDLVDVNAVDLYVDPADRAAVVARYRAGEEVAPGEIELRRRDGTRIWARVTSRRVTSPDGRLLYLEGAVEDVTDRRRAEQRLAESEELFRAVFENAPQGLVILDRNMVPQRVNAAFCEMLGMPEDEVLGTKGPDLKHPDDAEDAAARMEALREGRLGSYRIERRLRHKEGWDVWALVAVSPLNTADGDFGGMVSQVFDITELKQTQEALAESEARFRTAFESAPVGMAVFRPDLTMALANPALAEMLATSPAELERTSISALLTPEDLADAERRLGEIVAGTTEGYRVDRRLLRADGRLLWAHIDTHAVRAEDGELHCILTQVVDVTQRRLGEDAVARRDAENRALLDSIPDMMFRVDRDGVIQSWRPGRDFPPAVPPEEFLHHRVQDVLPDQGPRLLEVIRRALDANRTETVTYALETGGIERDFEANVAPVGEHEVLALVRDITERHEVVRRLEDMVMSREALVASVSHELRTPLTSILGFALLLDQDDATLDRSECVRLIIDQASELEAIIDDLLIAAQVGGPPMRVRIEAVDVVDEVEQVVASWLEGAAELIEPGRPVVAAADPVRFRQIVRNLLVNAARHGAGRIEISVEVKGREARIVVRDEGAPLPPEMWDSIFERHRSVARLSEQPSSFGIGLALSRELAERMAGRLVYQPVAGTSAFELSLPLRQPGTEVVP